MGCAHHHVPWGENCPSVYPTQGSAWLGVRKGQSEVGEVSILLVLMLFQDIPMDLETLSGQQSRSRLQSLGQRFKKR